MKWDPQNIRFPKALRTVEEEVSRSIGAVQVAEHDLFCDDDDTDDEVLDIGNLLRRMIASVKVRAIPRVI
jgi:hypothetical protein